jgi:universal stress protein A
MAEYKPKKILVPTDFSEPSDRAVRRALELARAWGSSVHLLHVLAPRLPECMGDYCIEESELRRVEAEAEREARQALRRQAERLKGDAPADLSTEVRGGRAEDELARTLREGGFDLVVLASRGSRERRHRLGGVSEQALRAAGVSVLLVPE